MRTGLNVNGQREKHLPSWRTFVDSRPRPRRITPPAHRRRGRRCVAVWRTNTGGTASQPETLNWQKFADFTLPHLYLAPPLGVTPFEFRKDFWHQKTRVPGLSCAVVCVILSVAVLIQYRLVTDRQTDGQTDGQTDTQTHDDS